MPISVTAQSLTAAQSQVRSVASVAASLTPWRKQMPTSAADLAPNFGSLGEPLKVTQ